MPRDAADVIQVLASGIESDEASATQLAEIAALARDAGDEGAARALRLIVQNHRIRALELAG